MLAMQWQLENTQWWPPDQLRHLQLEQLRALVGQAVANVPFYRDALARIGLKKAADLAWDSFAGWPVLDKASVRSREAALQALHLPREHGALMETFTSGSTGEPVRVRHTEVSQFFSHALVLRDHFWQERDFTAKLGAIRAKTERATHAQWSPIVAAAFRSGPAATFSASADTAEQLQWLLTENPAYLYSYPGNIQAIALLSRATARRPEKLRQVVTMASMVPAGLGQLVSEIWGAKLVDTYSCEEFGTLALQCPALGGLHVMAENVYLEVLRSDGTTCLPGETGRVVVTGLHNFAMPLIRYDLGDFAEVGGACPCGRGLPILKKIVGRARNMAVDPEGRRFWPNLNVADWLEIAPLRRWQVVQSTPDALEVRVIAERDLTAAEKEHIASFLQATLRYPYRIAIVRLDAFAQPAGQKFEDFLSLMPEPA